METISIITANWNNTADTVRCIESVMKLDTDLNVRIIVVDNGSTDGSAKKIADEYSDVCLIALPTNTGFARANNVGIAHALSESTDFIALVNNDATLAPD